MPVRAPRLLAVAIALLLVAGVVSAATYEDDSVDVAQRDATTTTTESDADDGAATTSTTAEATDPDVSTTDPGETTTTAPPPSTTPTTAVPATTGPPAAPDPDAPGTTPGTYVYDTTGTANGEDISGTSTLEVGAVGADGRQTHVQTAPDGKTTTIYRYAAEGTYLESMEIESDQGSFRLEATAPYLFLPSDAGPGTTTNGTLKGEDLTAEVEFTLVEVGAEQSKAALHVDLSGKIQGFDVEGTMDSTIVARTSDQLALEIDAKSDIEVGGGVFRVRSDTRSVLRR